MHDPLRRGTGGKINIPPPVWRFEKEGGPPCIAGMWGAGNQLRLSRTERKSAAAESQNKSGEAGRG